MQLDFKFHHFPNQNRNVITETFRFRFGKWWNLKSIRSAIQTLFWALFSLHANEVGFSSRMWKSLPGGFSNLEWAQNGRNVQIIILKYWWVCDTTIFVKQWYISGINIVWIAVWYSDLEILSVYGGVLWRYVIVASSLDMAGEEWGWEFHPPVCLGLDLCGWIHSSISILKTKLFDCILSAAVICLFYSDNIFQQDNFSLSNFLLSLSWIHTSLTSEDFNYIRQYYASWGWGPLG